LASSWFYLRASAYIGGSNALKALLPLRQMKMVQAWLENHRDELAAT
jgi:hypothetical protein